MSRKHKFALFINNILFIVVFLAQLVQADYSNVPDFTGNQTEQPIESKMILSSTIEQPPVDTKVILSSTAELHCKVRHDPSVSIHIFWRFNGNSLPSNRMKVMADGTLRIEQVRNTDVGVYTCNMESSNGNDSRSARLDVIELPHPPTNIKAKLNGGFVNVSWSPSFDGNSPIIKYIIQMKIVTDFSSTSGNDEDDLLYGVNTWMTASSNISSNQNFVLLTYNNLRPARTYQFRVSAVNNVGEGRPSSPSLPPITMPSQAPDAAPGEFVGAPRSSTAIMVQWQPPPPESHNGPLMGYVVRYKLAGYAEHTPWYHANVTNPAQLSVLLGDLIVWQNYEIQVAAYNEMGIGIFSPSIYVRTKEGRPASQVRNVKATALNSTAVEITWQSPDPQLINGINQGYKIQAWLNEENSVKPTLAKEMIVLPSPFSERWVMNGLEPFTTYKLTVLCFTSAGDGPKTDPPVIVKTKQDIPEEVPVLKFNDILDKSVKISWSRPSKINGELLGYTLKYYIVGSLDNIHEVNFTNLQNETVITNLRPQTSYTFEIRAWTCVGSGPPKISTIQSSIPPVLPLPPSHLAISNIGASSVVLQFIQGFNGNASITKWIVEAQYPKIRNSNWTIVYESTNHTQTNVITVYGLKPYTEYRLRLSPVNIVGQSLLSSEPSPSFQTLQAPPGPPAYLNFSEITMSQIKVSWAPPEEANGILLGYYITYETLVNDFSKQVKQKINNNYLVVSGLKECITYTFRVRAETSAGVGPEMVGNATTGPQPGSPPPPLNVRLSQTLTSVKLRWQNPDYRDITGYLIEGKNLALRSSGEWQPISYPKNGRQDRFELSFSHLAPSSQYTFRIMTVNSKGISEPSYPDKVDGVSVISTPSHLELRARLPYYRESWFVIMCACLSVVITIMVIAILCVKSKSYKYKQEAKKGSQEGLSEAAFGLDDINVIENHYPSGFELHQPNGFVGTMNTRRSTTSKTHANGASGLTATKSPPRPSPGSLTYSDEEEEKGNKNAAFYESSEESLTEKPSVSSSGPESESERDDYDNCNGAASSSHFGNHYANVNSTLRRGKHSLKKSPKALPLALSSRKPHLPTRASTSKAIPRRPVPPPVPPIPQTPNTPLTPAPPPPSYRAAVAVTSEENEVDGLYINLNDGRVIVNNMARSRAPLSGLTTFV